MRRLLIVVMALTASTWAVPAYGQGLFFSKRARPNPVQRVPELILTLKTDGDEHKRAAAAEELRDYDARTYGEIVPVLADALQHDGSANVRLEALNALSRMRPVTPAAGQALEQAAANDNSWRIRVQAKSALVKYHVAGYSSSAQQPMQPRNVTTAEPPLADPPGTPVAAPTITAPVVPVLPPTSRTQPAPRETPMPITIEVEGPALNPQR